MTPGEPFPFISPVNGATMTRLTEPDRRRFHTAVAALEDAYLDNANAKSPWVGMAPGPLATADPSWIVANTLALWHYLRGEGDAIRHVWGDAVAESLRIIFGPAALQKAASTISEMNRTLEGVLPYAIDPHGAGTRLQVLRNEAHAPARRTKKDAGSFYTPGDVVDVTIEPLLDASGSLGEEECVLDPACGTGIFLGKIAEHIPHWGTLTPNQRSKALLRHVAGIEIDSRAAIGASFFLSFFCWRGQRQTPPGNGSLGHYVKTVSQCITLQDAIEWMQLAIENPTLEQEPGQSRLVPSRITCVVGNPPYVRVQGASHGSASTSQLAVAFTSLATRLMASNSGRLALVLPLSLTYSTRDGWPTLRSLLRERADQVHVASYDRAPDALFGDDVKTRNSILFARFSEEKANRPCQFRTTALDRWASSSRQEFLSTRKFSPTFASHGDGGIPKIASPWEIELLSTLKKSEAMIGDECHVSRVSLQDAARTMATNQILVSPTAYNFIGLARQPPNVAGLEATSTNRHWLLEAKLPAAADAAYGLLASSFAFWWWRVWGDGFHVPRSQVTALPFSLSELASNHAFVEAARQQWAFAKSRAIMSVNRGRTSVSFPTPPGNARKALDRELLCISGADPDIQQALDAYYEEIVAARRPLRDGRGTHPTTPSTQEMVQA